MYLVCGEALFDFFQDRCVGETTGSLRFDARVGGSPFNVAIGIARLGGRSALLTGLSNDMLGEHLLQHLQKESVSRDYVLPSHCKTALSFVGLDAKGSPAYTFYGMDSADRDVTQDKLPVIGAEITGIHLGSYSLVVPPVADAFASLAKSAKGRFISVDPNVRLMIEPDIDIWRYRVKKYAELADLIKISSEDLDNLYPGTAYESKAAEWLDMGVKVVIITDGGRDIMAWTHQGLRASVKPNPIDVVDTVGAGDTFQAALLTRLAEYGDPKTVIENLRIDQLNELVNFAVKASSITCSRRGADLPYRTEM